MRTIRHGALVWAAIVALFAGWLNPQTRSVQGPIVLSTPMDVDHEHDPPGRYKTVADQLRVLVSVYTLAARHAFADVTARFGLAAPAHRDVGMRFVLAVREDSREPCEVTRAKESLDLEEGQ